MVFESTWKFNGKSYEPVSDAQINQIAGRAGRYRTARQDLEKQETPISGAPPEQNLGLVTTLEQMDFPQLSRAMQSEAQPIMSAGIFPPDSVVLRFAAYFPPDTPFSYILLRLHELSLMHPRFHLCQLRDGLFIADVIHSVQNLTISDRIVFCAAPASAREPNIGLVLQDLAKCVANNESGALLEIPNLNLDILNKPVTEEKDYLSKLESLHKALVLYLWLSYRFDGVFTSKAMAFYVKGLVEANIDKVLTQFSSKSRRRKRLRSLRHKAMLEEFAGQDWQRIPLDEASRTEKPSGIDRLLPTAKTSIESHVIDQTILDSTPFLQKSMIATQ